MTIDKTTKGGAKTIPSPNAPCTGFAADALPEVQKSDLTKNSNTGVSTQNVQLGSNIILSDTQDQENIGMHSVPLTAEKRKPTAILLQKAIEHITLP